MLNKYASVYSTRVDTYSDGRVYYYEQPFTVDSVSSAAMNLGDKKNPTAWNYSILKETYPTGRVEQFAYAGAPLPYLTRVGPIPGGNNTTSRVPMHPKVYDKSYNKCLERLNEKVRGKLDLSVAVAELSSTRRMLNVLNGLNGAVRDFRLRGLTFAKRYSHSSTKQASNYYLEWMYGWKPLLSDIYNAANETVNYVLNEIESVEASATIRYDNRDTVAVTHVSGDYVNPRLSGSGENKIRMNLRFRTNGHDVDRWSSLNPVTIAWELLPYSFVFDWFYDVGSTLRNLETSLLYRNSFVSGYISSLDYQNYSMQYKGQQNLAGEIRKSDFYASRKEISFSRTIMSQYPLPRLPTWNAKLGPERLFASAALLRQFISDPPLKGKQRRSTTRSTSRGLSFHEKRASTLLLKNGLVI